MYSDILCRELFILDMLLAYLPSVKCNQFTDDRKHET